MTRPEPRTRHPLAGRTALATIIVWSGVASIFVTQNVVANRPLTASMPWMRVLWFELEYWSVFAAFTPLFRWMTRRFAFERGRRLRSALAHLAAGSAFAAAQPMIADALNYATVYLVGGPSDPRLSRLVSSSIHGYPVLVIIALWKYVAIICICAGLEYYRRYRDQEVRGAQLRERLAQAELRTLQMQLQPHFLFNALNSAAMLTVVDPPRSHAVLVQLADLLRTTVGGDVALEVTLLQEMDFLDRYLAIERVRFGDRLAVRFEISEAVEAARVPSLILQPLVENAIRHGFSATAGAHHITVRAREEAAFVVLEVEDDGSGISTDWSMNDAHLGLSNVQARVDLANGCHEPIEFIHRSERGLIVRLRLPAGARSSESAA